jgi:hypothetical protein
LYRVLVCRASESESALSFLGLGDLLETVAAVGRVGLPQDKTMPASQPAFFGNVTVGGGAAPVRAYIEELLPDVLEGRIEPGRVFDRSRTLTACPTTTGR